MRRIGLVLGVLLLSVSAAAAQQQDRPDWHIYGGGVLGGEEYTRGAFGGTGAANDRFYVGVDGHGLWLDDAGQAQFRRLARQLGTDLTLTSYGMDVSIGVVAASSADGRAKFIPVGMIGYTRADIEACIGTFCDDESETAANYGAGFVAVFNSRVHLGLRYTRNYGAAMSVGWVFRTN